MADPHIEDQDSTWARTAKDLIAGAAGGIAQVLIGMRSTDASFLLLVPCSQPHNSDSSAFRPTCTSILDWIMFVAEIPFGMHIRALFLLAIVLSYMMSPLFLKTIES